MSRSPRYRFTIQHLSVLFGLVGLVAWGSVFWHAVGGPGAAAYAQFDSQSEANPLSRYMGDMQRYSHKLGHAIEHENRKLADFYVGEIRENIEFIRSEFKTYEQLPIGAQIQMLDAPARSLKAKIETGEWRQARSKYEQMIQVCNACHAAVQRPFVVIEPIYEGAGYNQRFKPDK